MNERYLLDTNVLSELCRPAPDAAVIDFVGSLDQFWLSVITLHELRYGVELLAQNNKRHQLELALSALTRGYESQVLAVDIGTAELATSYRGTARKAGSTLNLADSLIAATAIAADGLVAATRNIKDFKNCPVTCHNPFT